VVEPLAIVVDRERVTAWLIRSGWLDEEESSDIDAIEGALSDAISFWLSNPDHDPPVNRHDQPAR
jgi:hypothetical protein